MKKQTSYLNCFYCKNEINKGQEYASLISHDKKGAISHEAHFHRKCYRDWIEEKVVNRVKQLVETIKKQAKPLIKAKMGMVM
jgi:hypothetical protein